VTCYPPSPESGIEPEDNEPEENLEEVADSEAKEDDEEDIEDVEDFTVKRQKHVVDELIDTAELGPSYHQDDDVDDFVLVDLAPEASAPPAPKRTAGVFADEDDTMFES
jgi:hypothetical protein